MNDFNLFRCIKVNTRLQLHLVLNSFHLRDTGIPIFSLITIKSGCAANLAAGVPNFKENLKNYLFATCATLGFKVLIFTTLTTRSIADYIYSLFFDSAVQIRQFLLPQLNIISFQTEERIL